jgi:hypothetical protein
VRCWVVLGAMRRDGVGVGVEGMGGEVGRGRRIDTILSMRRA